jgi:1-acyl-sn-glycerol-3-phosphate acyltransferase
MSSSKEIADLQSNVSSLLKGVGEAKDNRSRRIIHSKIELLDMDIQEMLTVSPPPITAKEASALQKQLRDVSATLSLDTVDRGNNWYDALDGVLRLSAAWLVLIYSGWVCLLCFLLQPLDNLLVGSLKVVHPYNSLNVLVRRMVGYLVLVSSGVELIVQNQPFSSASSLSADCGIEMISYSHSSTMDAFIISTALPRSLALVKQELFLIPFFAWMLAVWGGIPINRKNRNAAVKSLDMVSLLARPGDIVQISPEGTRSTNGLLLPYKKGPFYMWEQLGGGTITPLMIYGAFELHPPTSHFSRCGRVYARYLPPITLPPRRDGESDSSRREAAAKLLRRAMLLDIRDSTPQDVSVDIDWRQRLQCLLVVGTMHTLNLFVAYTAVRHLVLHTTESMTALLSYSVAMRLCTFMVQLVLVIVLITLLLFVFAVYIQEPLLRVLRSGKHKHSDHKKHA